MRNGIIKWYNCPKGYGFVYDNVDGAEYFFHWTDIISDQEFKKFYENEHVTFDIKESNRGLCAGNVTKVKRVK